MRMRTRLDLLSMLRSRIVVITRGNKVKRFNFIIRISSMRIRRRRGERRV